MKKIEERKNLLLQTLSSKGRMDIKEATDLLNISEATARRLFTQLQKEDKVLRTHGGVQIIHSYDSPNDKFRYSFDDSRNVMSEEKESIGTSASTLIDSNDTVFLESGTTVLRLCTRLADRIRQGAVKNITVFTNSLANLQALDSVCKVILIGGEYRRERQDFAGFVSSKIIKNFRFTQCFLGADGVDMNEGFMATDIDTAQIDELIISRSEKATILLDSAKFNRRSLITFATFNDICCMVTDRNADEKIIRNMESKDIKVIRPDSVNSIPALLR
ncbi:MAG: DeoR/GlpR family DNA-binding transcription regulator [Eubacteriales bacterium]|nr:DeoR/GlpR family DNA-binding transcription regulator [Eubacteriales bacterium]